MGGVCRVLFYSGRKNQTPCGGFTFEGGVCAVPEAGCLCGLPLRSGFRSLGGGPGALQPSVPEDSVGVVESGGKFSRLLFPGVHFLPMDSLTPPPPGTRWVEWVGGFLRIRGWAGAARPTPISDDLENLARPIISRPKTFGISPHLGVFGMRGE